MPGTVGGFSVKPDTNPAGCKNMLPLGPSHNGRFAVLLSLQSPCRTDRKDHHPPRKTRIIVGMQIVSPRSGSPRCAKSFLAGHDRQADHRNTNQKILLAQIRRIVGSHSVRSLRCLEPVSHPILRKLSIPVNPVQKSSKNIASSRIANSAQSWTCKSSRHGLAYPLRKRFFARSHRQSVHRNTNQKYFQQLPRKSA